MEGKARGTVYQCFARTAERCADRPFLNVLEETANVYGIEAGQISYAQMKADVDLAKQTFFEQGYGPGHRVGLLLENRPSFFICWLALNGLGVSVVPINPDLREDDLRYLLEHSEQVLAIVTAERLAQVRRTATLCKTEIQVISPAMAIPKALSAAGHNPVDEGSEAALLYTSGTTGLPKGCVLSNTYFLNCGDWYRTVGGHCALADDGDRMLTPLPLFHMNAMACSVMAMVSTGGCLTLLDRFHPRSWWQSVAASRATIVHYLGVMPTMLMAAQPCASDKAHSVRFGFGAGVDRTLHAPFEERFGFPLIEAWAMTETGNGAVVAASHEPRHVGTNCFGKPAPGVEYTIAAEGDAAGGDGEGELLVRRAGPDPRYGFFDRYLKDEAATEEAWRDGWFHTGDIVRLNPDGTLVFVDRRKNVIRRSGENIAALEVEAVLMRHDLVRAAAVCATPDAIRGDEVFACIVPVSQTSDREAENELAHAIVHYCLDKLAYYKAPGYISFVEDLPLTATNKVQRGEMKALVAELVSKGRHIDTRALKKRSDIA